MSWHLFFFLSIPLVQSKLSKTRFDFDTGGMSGVRFPTKDCRAPAGTLRAVDLSREPKREDNAHFITIR